MSEQQIEGRAFMLRLIPPVLLASLSYFWLFSALMNTRAEVAASDVYLTVALTTLVLAIQAAILIFAKSLARILSPAFGLLNTYVLYMVLSGDFSVMSVWTQMGICAAIMLLFWVTLDIVLRADAMRKWLVLGIPGLVAVFIGISALPLLTEKDEPDNTPPANIKAVEFKSKPNIYFLSFDAMVPASLSTKFTGIPNPAYMDILKKHGANFIPNNFSDAIPTKRSLANILTMSPIATADKDTRDIVSGKAQSALHYILSANGYQTHFTFAHGFFGTHKGPYLTHYNVHRPYSACRFLEGNAQRFGFFGYCQLRSLKAFDKLINGEGDAAFFDYAYDLVQSIARDKKSGPHFYMQDILFPSHTPTASFDGSEAAYASFKPRYEQLSRVAAGIMDKMLTEIRASDPNAIIFLYGDHGLFVSRHAKYENDPRFFIQDRHGTMGAFINAERCEPYLTPPEGERFQTNARLVTGLVRCLAGGESPFINEVDFGAIRAVFDFRSIRDIKKNERFENYVYE